jgi:hypothetical protein
VNDDLERMWKEAAVAKFKMLSQHLLGGAEENHENLNQDSQSPGRDLNPGHPEYEAEMLTTRPLRMVQ